MITELRLATNFKNFRNITKLAHRQIYVLSGTHWYAPRPALPMTVVNRFVHEDTVKKRALEARSKLQAPKLTNSKTCNEPSSSQSKESPSKKKPETCHNTKILNARECCVKPEEPKKPGDSNKNLKWILALLALGGLGVLTWLLTRKDKKKETNYLPRSAGRIPASSADIPKHVPYLLIGGGAASFSAFRSIKSNDPKAKIMIISNECTKPYMRPPLSKELWYSVQNGELPKELKFKQWTGAERSLYFEPEEFFLDPTKLMSSDNGGLSVCQGYTVKKVNASKRIATLTDGTEITYDQCLLATGCSPKNLSVFSSASQHVKDKIMVYRTQSDFEYLKGIAETKKSITIVGSGFVGSELACSLAHYGKSRNLKVNQVYQESGNMAKILPQYLSKWTTKKVSEQDVCIIPQAEVISVERDHDNVKLKLSNGKTILTDQVVVCVGCEANTNIASVSGLEIHSELGGFVVNSELEARRNLFVAGDAACFYDPLLGRRRVEHHDHSVVSGRLAGENMAGEKKQYEHQSMFWSDLGPDIGYEGIGLVDSSLPTVGVFAKSTEIIRKGSNLDGTANCNNNIPVSSTNKVNNNDDANDEDDFSKGVVFYLKNNKVVGILLWNLFNRIGLARTIIKENKSYDDLNEVAKLFDIHS